jgi:hypothetical protein
MQRSPKGEAMGHTSVFPIAENKVAAAGMPLSRQINDAKI